MSNRERERERPLTLFDLLKSIQIKGFLHCITFLFRLGERQIYSFMKYYKLSGSYFFFYV